MKICLNNDRSKTQQLTKDTQPQQRRERGWERLGGREYLLLLWVFVTFDTGFVSSCHIAWAVYVARWVLAISAVNQVIKRFVLVYADADAHSHDRINLVSCGSLA